MKSQIFENRKYWSVSMGRPAEHRTFRLRPTTQYLRPNGTLRYARRNCVAMAVLAAERAAYAERVARDFPESWND